MLPGIYTPGMGATIRFLGADDVRAAMPPIDDRLALAERAMIELADGADMPPKIGVHPRMAGSFAHAMPAYLRTPGLDGSADLLGIKWVAGFPTNRTGTDRDRDVAAIHALVVVNDPVTGVPTAILDGGPITAERTAAVSGVAIRRFALTGLDRPPVVAVLGAGVQGASHLPVIGATLPGASVIIHDRHLDRAAALAATAVATDGIGSARVSAEARAATVDADVVISAVTFTTPDRWQSMTDGWLGPNALVVPVDYESMCAASVAASAALFLVDDLPQFEATRATGRFTGYPDPATTFGRAIREGLGRPPTGRVVATHLGVGLADVLFADAIVGRAAAGGLGTILRT
jgi:ornithine cyclodeaminase/alanine dehydrogenase-like protein (mu-crystallin family)